MPPPADDGVLNGPGAAGRHHLNAIDRTGRHAQVAAGAPVFQHGVHMLVGAHDGVHRTGLDAQRTADAMGFVDAGDQQRAGFAAGQVQGQGGGVQQGGQCGDAFVAAGRTAIDRGGAIGDGVGIGPAAVVPALGALRLRQQGINAVGK
ncbi:hypothetical protein D3C72_1839620 [compost metagenome]